MTQSSHVFTQAANGLRLDSALAEILPHLGLRARRRFLAKNFALLNGAPVAAATRVRSGDILVFDWESEPEPEQKPEELLKTEDYILFHKPAGWHTQALAGQNGPNLENWLAQHEYAAARLLQRLDQFTTGIVCAARNAPSAGLFRQYELGGECNKYYLAVLAGMLDQPVRCGLSLETRGGKKVRIKGKDADSILHTSFQPLLHCNFSPLVSIKTAVTIALCAIKKGQRHQIRAHAAAIGFPLLGDDLYGQAASRPYFLEHFALSLPGLSAISLCKSEICQINPHISDLAKAKLPQPINWTCI